jgi:sugar phosphate isomerase/epimerase
MRLAFSTLACPDWPFERVVDAAVRYGYQGIELRIIDGELVSPSMSPAQRDRTKRAMTDAGCELCCVDTSFEIANPRASLDEALASIELAAELEAPMIRLFAGAPDGEAWSTTIARTSERLATLSAHGRSLGVAIGLETHDSFATGEVLAKVVKNSAPEIGVIWDTLNPVVAGESPDRTFASIADRLVHVHIKDGALPPDLEENRLLGEGRVPIRAILRMLATHGYERWLSVEWEKKWQPAIPDADVALPWYADRLRIMLAEPG